MALTNFKSSLNDNEKLIHFSDVFLNGTNDAMDVNGVITPVDFIIGPPSGEIWHAIYMGLVIEDTGTLDPTDFGALPTLTNGFQILQDIDSTEKEIANLKRNYGISFMFTSGNNFAGVPAGFLNTGNLFSGLSKLSPEIILNGDNGDKLIARVRDNLIGLVELHMGATFWRFI